MEFDKINVEDSDSLTVQQLASIRDETIIDQADILIPVSVRTGGNMSKLLSKSHVQRKTIVREFETGYEKKKSKLAYQIDISALSEKLKAFDKSYLIHWTRGTNCRWPDENQLEFYKTIFDSDKYRRTTFDTLHNILSGQSIIASSKNMPANTKTVCFSGLVPEKAIRLMKWRSRYCQMSFEPFGIGIERNYAMAHGIREVRYFEPSQEQQCNKQVNWWWQSSGQKTDWRNEKEFRHKGNFDLSKVPEEKRLVFCHYKSQAALIQNQTGLKAMSFYN